jgi:hypothetical protein
MLFFVSSVLQFLQIQVLPTSIQSVTAPQLHLPGIAILLEKILTLHQKTTIFFRTKTSFLYFLPSPSTMQQFLWPSGLRRSGDADSFSIQSRLNPWLSGEIRMQL